MRLGFVGLGNLGGHLAASLLRHGFTVTVHDRDADLAARLVALGATWADSAADVAANSDTVLTCLPSPAVSEAVLAQMLPAMRDGGTWIEMSTLGRDDILRLAALAQAQGVRVLEAPVTGGVHLAARGEITVLAGIKVITNMLAFIHLVADGEALMLAKRAGLDLKTAWEAIAASSGTSFVHETEGQLILNGSYDIAFSMDLALKDLGFAMGFGQEFGVPLDLAGQVQQTFVKGRAAYGGQAQSTQIVKLLEDVLETDLRADGFPARLE